MSKRWLNATHKPWLIGVFLLALYPALVLGYVWYHCFISDFRGGKNGQLDAYRHTLASAMVAYTLSPKAVSLFTDITESTINLDDLMDRHNNKIGSTIGQQAKLFSQIDGLVSLAVQNGAENAQNIEQITWLPKYWWQDSLLW